MLPHRVIESASEVDVVEPRFMNPTGALDAPPRSVSSTARWQLAYGFDRLRLSMQYVH